jgi:hypothetical protein
LPRKKEETNHEEDGDQIEGEQTVAKADRAPARALIELSDGIPAKTPGVRSPVAARAGLIATRAGSIGTMAFAGLRSSGLHYRTLFPSQ